MFGGPWEPSVRYLGLVIHRNHSFGFSFAETNWVSVSTETRFEFRSTEPLTETHILVIFYLFWKIQKSFLQLWIQFYSKITEKHQNVFGHLLLYNVQDDDKTNYGFRSGFRFWFQFRRNFWVSVSVSTETKKVVSVNPYNFFWHHLPASCSAWLNHVGPELYRPESNKSKNLGRSVDQIQFTQ